MVLQQIPAAPAAPPPPGRGSGPGGARRPAPAVRSAALAVVLAAPVSLLVLVVALVATGAAVPGVLDTASPAVRWGLPVVRVVGDLAASLVIGSLLLLALALVPGTPAWARGARAAAVGAVAWVVTAALEPVLAFADIAGEPLGAPSFGAHLGFFLTTVAPGQLLLASGVLVLLAGTVAALGATGPGWAATGAVLSAVALVPTALGSHSGAASGHHTAMTAWWLHGLGVGAWAGGLVALVVVGPALGAALPVVVRRASAVFLGAYLLVVVSGLASAWVQVGASWAGLRSSYGALVGVKLAIAAALGAAGWLHRRRAIATLDGAAGTAVGGPAGTGRAFWRLVAGEVVLMAAAVGVAVTMVRLGPPATAADDAPLSLAEQATGQPLPPLPATLGRLLGEPAPDLLWLVLVAAMVVAYAAGLARMRARGDAWPLGRSAAWFGGCAVLVWVTSWGPAAYMDLLFSAHMVGHMVLMMVVPPLLVVGAPVTLALRTLRKRRDGSRGPREWVSVLVHSRVATAVSHPVVAAAIFVGSLVVFYYTPLFGLALSTHVGMQLMMVHFLATGYLFASALIGVDPGAARASYPLRLVLLLATMASHAFFGVALMQSDALLAADWFTGLGLGVDALADQRTAGGIAWGLGELPTLVITVVLAVQWSRSDTREARRRDRAADRDGDAELAAYNAMLARRAAVSSSSAPGGSKDG